MFIRSICTVILKFYLDEKELENKEVEITITAEVKIGDKVVEGGVIQKILEVYKENIVKEINEKKVEIYKESM